MAPGEVLHAATIGSSKMLERSSKFGTLEAGGFVDSQILDKDPRIDIRSTLSIHEVRDGRLYIASTLDED
jgi:imidazolonepropionase-like amidohydrolase